MTGNLTIPDKVTTIDYGAFWECSGFTGYLLLGKSIVSIGRHAFTKDGGRIKETYWESYTLQLRFSRIYCKATTPPSIYVGEIKYYDTDDRFNNGYEDINIWYSSDYGGCIKYPTEAGGTFRDDRDEKLSQLYVPTGSQATYESKTQWQNTFDLIQETEF